ncbi:MAG: gluconate 2-dehydrogenase subunit 3 family protein [Proteobacteria bacterium]|nr:gluconate 2-dehydrogenase subunit 3 family protein [Pseudomonadota bacterium]
MARRDFIVSGALLTFALAGCQKKMTPAQARAADVPFRTLSAGSVAVLDALGEILLPGSSVAGLAHYIDHQLSADPADSMLMIKYLEVTAPFTGFYEGGLRATDALARAMYGKAWTNLSREQATALVTKMSGGQVEGWQGPPAGLFYFVLRSDAVDVMYGTKSGFEKLGVPYMAHIEPPSRWGE